MSRFGTDITSDDIVDTLSFFDSWEDRYKYIIDLDVSCLNWRPSSVPRTTWCAVVRVRYGWCAAARATGYILMLTAMLSL